MKTKKQGAGFSLVELMIIVVMVSILTTLALPSFLTYILQARRADAQQVLLDMAIRQGIWRSNNATYGSYADLGSPVIPHYNNPVVSGISATSFTLTASAAGGQADDSEAGTSCTPLTYALNGTTVTKGPVNCWD